MSTLKDKRDNPADVIDVFIEVDPLKSTLKPPAATTHLYRNTYFMKQQAVQEKKGPAPK